VAVIAPHAGHIYSGAVAGHAFAAVRGRALDLVVIVSPMHQPYVQPLLTSAHEAYQTPLGIIPIDREAQNMLNDHLQGTLGFGLHAIHRDREHSLEIELPFLQRALSGAFSLLPVMVRDTSPETLRVLGHAIAKITEHQSTLLVASTDLSHFYPQNVAERLDAEMLRRIEAFDPLAVLQAEAQGKGFACGRGAVAAVLWASRALGADTVTVLAYATSGDVTADHTQVVGYGSAAITRKTDQQQVQNNPN
ncbi:MAG TPA: AmmeMemoRadiSam system protein B, partial [Anaerolineales bacterium]|nr:AmmeMemoRadiSam system protein B [Anaerolineales bacterium]